MPLSFFEFVLKTIEQPVLALTVCLTLSVLLVNGWTDAPNSIAGVVATGTLSFRHAVWMAAVFNFLGVFCVTSVSTSVAETVYSIASFRNHSSDALTALCAAMTAIVLWAAAAWRFGIPTSESHALVAGISGSAIAFEGSLSCIRWDCWGRVLIGLLLSVLGGFFLGSRFSEWLSYIKLNNITIKLLQVIGAAISAFLHGAQDGQKFLGIFLLGSALAQGRNDVETFLIPPWLMLLCAFFMALGTIMGGRRIINKIGHDLVSLSCKDSLAADFGSILGLSAATLLGLPVSTTHARTSGLLGAGFASAGQANWSIARQILIAWFLTFPGCLAISYWMTRLFLHLL